VTKPQENICVMCDHITIGFELVLTTVFIASEHLKMLGERGGEKGTVAKYYMCTTTQHNC